MTNIPVVDSHHHFWDPTRRDYYWMEGDELASIRKPIGPEDLRPLLVQNKVDRTVIVQTVPTVEETEEFLSIAAGTDFVAGVVGWVDLTDPGVSDTLAELKRHGKQQPGSVVVRERRSPRGAHVLLGTTPDGEEIS